MLTQGRKAAKKYRAIGCQNPAHRRSKTKDTCFLALRYFQWMIGWEFPNPKHLVDDRLGGLEPEALNG